MKKFIYMITIALTMLIGVDVVSAKETIDIASCTYNYGPDTLKLTVTETSSFWTISNSLSKIKTQEYTYGYGYKFDKEFISSMYTRSTIEAVVKRKVSACPKLKFGITKNKTSGEITFVFVDLMSSVSETCGGEENNETCDSKTGVTGVLEILAKNIEEEEKTEKIYCEKTYEDSKLGQVTAQTFTDGKNNYFRLYDSNGKILGSAMPGGWFKVGDYYYSVPNISSLFTENCNRDDLTLNANKDRVQNPDNTGNSENKKDNYPITNGETIKIIKQVYNIIKIIIPVLIIIFSIIDFLKVILISDDKNYKSAWDKFIKRVIIGVIFFLVPLLVSFLLNISGIDIDQSYLEIFK